MSKAPSWTTILENPEAWQSADKVFQGFEGSIRQPDWPPTTAKKKPRKKAAPAMGGREPFSADGSLPQRVSEGVGDAGLLPEEAPLELDAEAVGVCSECDGICLGLLASHDPADQPACERPLARFISREEERAHDGS
jgi:hypothetical protein